MSNHEIFNEHLDAPDGYDTYSILLITDYDWQEHNNLKDTTQLLKTFLRFGNIIGKKHFAGWFYTSGRSSYGPMVDIDISAIISANVSTNQKLRKFLDKRSNKPKNLEYLEISVDIQRARLLCTMWGLPYNGAPYIAVFDENPTIPSIHEDSFATREDNRYFVTKNIATKPIAVISLNNLSINKVVTLIDTLEQQILTDQVSNKSLRWKKIRLYLSEWNDRNQKNIVRVIDKFSTIAAKAALKKVL